MVTMSKLRLVSALSVSLAVVGLGRSRTGSICSRSTASLHRQPGGAVGRGVAIRGNRITAVGTTAAIRQTAGADTFIVDVGGASSSRNQRRAHPRGRARQASC
jgi:hypothetical protein